MTTIIGTDTGYAAELLKQGELVAVPTETVYGLAGNALDENAILKIYHAKDRPRFNPLILHVDSFEHVERYVTELPHDCIKLAKTFSPGPLTFLLRKKQNVPDLLTAGSEKVAVRIPNHPMLSELLAKLGFPLAAPSANASGYVSPVTAQHVYEGLNGRIPYILDGGECKIGIESTIIGFENDEVIMYRRGGISKEAIEKQLGKKIKVAIAHSAPETPGQLKSHYATSTPLYFGEAEALISRFANKRAVVITLDKQYSNIAPAFQFQLSPAADLDEAARNLFKTLRQADQLDADLIIAQQMPDKEMGTVINDRLQRAQHTNKIDHS